MRVTLYIKKEDLEKLAAFLQKGEILDICWAERSFMDFVQVTLDYTEYLSLIEISAKMEEESEEPIMSEETINFLDMPPEDLVIFNLKGLYSLQQLQQSFEAGSAYRNAVHEEELGNVFKEPLDFKNWFDKHILKHAN